MMDIESRCCVSCGKFIAFPLSLCFLSSLHWAHSRHFESGYGGSLQTFKVSLKANRYVIPHSLLYASCLELLAVCCFAVLRKTCDGTILCYPQVWRLTDRERSRRWRWGRKMAEHKIASLERHSGGWKTSAWPARLLSPQPPSISRFQSCHRVCRKQICLCAFCV